MRAVLIILSVLVCLSYVKYSNGRLTPDQAHLKCTRFSALYSNIDTDLARWGEAGISLPVMQQTIAKYTTRKSGQKGFAAGFWKGKVYLIDEPKLPGVAHVSRSMGGGVEQGHSMWLIMHGRQNKQTVCGAMHVGNDC